jgi:hypothetical protein
VGSRAALQVTAYVQRLCIDADRVARVLQIQQSLVQMKDSVVAPHRRVLREGTVSTVTEIGAANNWRV